MSTPADPWQSLGQSGNPVPGNIDVLKGIQSDFAHLQNTASYVSSGLDRFLQTASSGGFEGQTADALRNAISGRLKTFIDNIAAAFGEADQAMGAYISALSGAQTTVNGAYHAASTATATTDLTGQKNAVSNAVGDVSAAARKLEAALGDAANKVSQPIKVPSFWHKFWKGFWTALEFIGGALAIISSIIDGPVGLAAGLAAFAAGTASLIKTAVDFAHGHGSWLNLGLSILGVLMPGGKGFLSLKDIGAGLKALAAGGKAALGTFGRGAVSALHIVTNPTALRDALVFGLHSTADAMRFGASRFGDAALRLPGLLSRGAARLPGALHGLISTIPGLIRNGYQVTRSAVLHDFASVTAHLSTGLGGKIGVYALTVTGRLALAALTPMRFAEMSALGFRGAFQAMLKEYSVLLPSALRGADTAGRTRGLATAGGDLGSALGGGLHAGRTGEPGGRIPGGLLLPQGTPSVFAGHLPPEPLLTTRLDNLGGRIAPGVSSRPGLDRLATPRTLDEHGTPVNVATLLRPEPSVVDQQIQLDAHLGLVRTHAGVLVPTESLLAPGMKQVVEGLGPEGVHALATGTFDVTRARTKLTGTLTGGVTGGLGRTTPAAEHLTAGVPGDLRGVTAGAGHFDAAHALDLLNGGPRVPGEAKVTVPGEVKVTVPGGSGAHVAPVGSGRPPATYFEAVTGGVGGKLGAERIQAWNGYQNARQALDMAGQHGAGTLGHVPSGLTHLDTAGTHPDTAGAHLDRAQAEQNLHTAEAHLHALGMNPVVVEERINLLATRGSAPGAGARAPLSLPDAQLQGFAQRFGKFDEQTAHQLWAEASRITAQHATFELSFGRAGEGLLERAPAQYWSTLRVAQTLDRFAGAPDRIDQAVATAKEIAAERGLGGMRQGLLGGAPKPVPEGFRGPEATVAAHPHGDAGNPDTAHGLPAAPVLHEHLDASGARPVPGSEQVLLTHLAAEVPHVPALPHVEVPGGPSLRTSLSHDRFGQPRDPQLHRLLLEQDPHLSGAADRPFPIADKKNKTGLDANGEPLSQPQEVHRILAYFSGEMPIHGAALLLRPSHKLEIHFDGVYFLDEYKYLAHKEGFPDALSYVRAHSGSAPGDDAALARQLIGKGLAAAQRMRDELVRMGIAPDRIRLIHHADAEQDFPAKLRHVSDTHKIVSDSFLAPGGRLETVRTLHQAAVGSVAPERLAAIENGVRDALGLERGDKVFLLWMRRSAMSPGGAYPELDMPNRFFTQIADHLKQEYPGARIIPVGDEPGRELRAAHPELFTRDPRDDLINFWTTHGLKGRNEQFAVMDFLAREHDAVAIGMESGAIEMPSLLGMKTVYLERRAMRDGKAERWTYVSGASWGDPAHGEWAAHPARLDEAATRLHDLTTGVGSLGHAGLDAVRQEFRDAVGQWRGALAHAGDSSAADARTATPAWAAAVPRMNDALDRLHGELSRVGTPAAAKALNDLRELRSSFTDVLAPRGQAWHGAVGTWRRQQFEAPTEWLFYHDRLGRLADRLGVADGATHFPAAQDATLGAVREWRNVISGYRNALTETVVGQPKWTELSDRLDHALSGLEQRLLAQDLTRTQAQQAVGDFLAHLPRTLAGDGGPRALEDLVTLGRGELERLTAQINGFRDPLVSVARDQLAEISKWQKRFDAFRPVHPLSGEGAQKKLLDELKGLEIRWRDSLATPGTGFDLKSERNTLNGLITQLDAFHDPNVLRGPAASLGHGLEGHPAEWHARALALKDEMRVWSKQQAALLKGAKGKGGAAKGTSDPAPSLPRTAAPSLDPALREFAQRFGKLDEQTAGRLWTDASRITEEHSHFPVTIGRSGAGLAERDPERYWATMRVAHTLDRLAGAPDRIDQAVAVAKQIAAERGVGGMRQGLLGGAPDRAAAGTSGLAHLPGAPTPPEHLAEPRAIHLDLAGGSASPSTVPLSDLPGHAGLTGARTPHVPLDPIPEETLRELPLTLAGAASRYESLLHDLRVRIREGESGRTLELAGPHGLSGHFAVTPVQGRLATRFPGGFVLADTRTGDRFHVAADGRLALAEVKLERNLGTLRMDLTGPHPDPEIRNAMGTMAWELRAEMRGDGLVKVEPSTLADRPLEHLVADPATGRIVEETVAVPGERGALLGEYWKLDHLSGQAYRLDAAGHVQTGALDRAAITHLPNGEVRLVNEDRVLFRIPNRLRAALDQAVNLHGIVPRPVWRETREALFRFDDRGPETIFKEGFAPRDVRRVGLGTYVDSNHPAAFVSTTVDSGLDTFPKAFTYEIHAPGGIDVNRTLPDNHFEHEKEIAFAGGIKPRYIKGAWENGSSRSFVEGRWIDNPHFDPGSFNDPSFSRRFGSFHALSESHLSDAATPLPFDAHAAFHEMLRQAEHPNAHAEPRISLTPSQQALAHLLEADTERLHIGQIEDLVARAEPAFRELRIDPGVFHRDLLDIRVHAYAALLSDARQAAQDFRNAHPVLPEGEHAIGDFRLSALPEGRVEAVHTDTGLRTVLERNGGWTYREHFLGDAPPALSGLKAAVTRGPLGRSYHLVGPDHLASRFSVTSVRDASRHIQFTVVERATGHRFTFTGEGTLVASHPPLAGGVGEAPSGLSRSASDVSLPEHFFSESVPVRYARGRLTGDSWRIDPTAGSAVRLDAGGRELTGRYDTAAVERSLAGGGMKLVGADKVVLFEREVLGSGHVLDVHWEPDGRARWTEFDAAGNPVRTGDRTFDQTQRSYHDRLSGTVFTVDRNDVRHYTKAADGGLVRAEKGSDGRWTWQRFDANGRQVLSGERHWSWSGTHIGFRDVFRDPATGAELVAQRRGDMWLLGSWYHSARQYKEYAIAAGTPGVDHAVYTAYGPVAKVTESREVLADGSTLKVRRFSEQRVPAAFWKGRAGGHWYDGFFRNFFSGESMNRVHHWTERAPGGGVLRGVRVEATDKTWRDIDQYGRVVRESRRTEGGRTVEYGRGPDGTWAPAPRYEPGRGYTLPWRDTKDGGLTGTRYVDASGHWEDAFTVGDREHLALRSQGLGVREYLAEHPPRGIAADDRSGVWVDKTHQAQIIARRDHWGDQYVEAHGSSWRTTWTWRAYAEDDPGRLVGEGVRRQNRGSMANPAWDDSFRDLNPAGELVRERNATDSGSTWVDATRLPDGTWVWRKFEDGGATLHSEGRRGYLGDPVKGHWSDTVDGVEVRFNHGWRVREFAYRTTVGPRPFREPVDPVRQAMERQRLHTLHTIAEETPEEIAAAAHVSLADLLRTSEQHFRPSVTVDREVWKEFDQGRVITERRATDTPGRYRVEDKQHEQWREFQDGHLVAQRTYTGRIWQTDPFGRWHWAKIPESAYLPKVGSEVGRPGDRGWRLIGRQTDHWGWNAEFEGIYREFRDPDHYLWQGVRNGESVRMPGWKVELRKLVTQFVVGYVTSVGTGLAATAAENHGHISTSAWEKALFGAAVSGATGAATNLLLDRTLVGRPQYLVGNLDWGLNAQHALRGQTDDWTTDMAKFAHPTRWRGAAIGQVLGLPATAFSGFVGNVATAGVFGVNGNDVDGAGLLLAGGWGAAGNLFSGVTTGLARSAWHLTAAGRLFARGSFSDLTWAAIESFGGSIASWALTTNVPATNIGPGTAFPKPATPPPPPARPPATP